MQGGIDIFAAVPQAPNLALGSHGLGLDSIVLAAPIASREWDADFADFLRQHASPQPQNDPSASSWEPSENAPFSDDAAPATASGQALGDGADATDETQSPSQDEPTAEGTGAVPSAVIAPPAAVLAASQAFDAQSASSTMESAEAAEANSAAPLTLPQVDSPEIAMPSSDRLPEVADMALSQAAETPGAPESPLSEVTATNQAVDVAATASGQLDPNGNAAVASADEIAATFSVATPDGQDIETANSSDLLSALGKESPTVPGNSTPGQAEPADLRPGPRLRRASSAMQEGPSRSRPLVPHEVSPAKDTAALPAMLTDPLPTQAVIESTDSAPDESVPQDVAGALADGFSGELASTILEMEGETFHGRATLPQQVIAGQVTADQLDATTRPGAPSETQIDRIKLVELATAALQAAQARRGEVQLQLMPPELGIVHVNLVIREGALQAHLETETERARSLLLASVDALRQRLAEFAIKIERFQVDLMNQNLPGSQQQAMHDRKPSRPAAPAGVPPSAPRSLNVPVASPLARSHLRGGVIDIQA